MRTLNDVEIMNVTGGDLASYGACLTANGINGWMIGGAFAGAASGGIVGAIIAAGGAAVAIEYDCL